MVDNDPFSVHGERLNERRFQGVLDAVHGLIRLKADILEPYGIFVASSGGPVEDPALELEVIGVQTDLADSEKSIETGEVLLVLYDKNKAAAITQLVSEQQAFDAGAAELLGHLQFSRVLDDAATSGVLYFTDDNRVLITIDGEIKPEEALGEESQACYELLNQVGLSDFWVSQLMFREDARRASYVGSLEDNQAFVLEKFLNSYMPPEQE